MANLNVKTSFNTILSLQSETLGKRLLAFVLDIVVIVLYWVGIWWIFSVFNIDFEGAFGGDYNRVVWGWFSLVSLPILFYSLVSETVSGGYTLGKYIAKIKVVKIDGFQPSFVEFFIRWIFRMIDIYAFMLVAILAGGIMARIFSFYTIGLVGLIVIVRSKKGQRLGDMVAGTSVIKSKIKQSINITILKEVEDSYEPKYSQVLKLSDNDARIIKETFESARKMKDVKLIRKLVVKLETVMGIKNTDKPEQFINDVLKDFNYYTQNM
ncbi:RDD family protein [Bacteroidia bacterium]|nr:RDD family protein [Bacteroidia bacterium]